MIYTTLTPEQQLIIVKLASIAKAGQALAESAFFNEVEICDLVLLVTATAKKKLAELRGNNPL